MDSVYPLHSVSELTNDSIHAFSCSPNAWVEFDSYLNVQVTTLLYFLLCGTCMPIPIVLL